MTLDDVAKDSGVSRATVSLVLRGSSLVAQETAKKVQQSLSDLGYVYNRAAANLRTQKSHIVGVVLCSTRNPFYPEMIRAIQSTLEETDTVVMFSDTDEQVERQQRAIASLLEHNIDGLLIAPAEGSSKEDMAGLQMTELPTVFVTRYVEGLRGNYVGPENVLGAEQATAWLLDGGYTRLAFIGGSQWNVSRRDRLQGFTRAHIQRGLRPDPGLIVETEGSKRGGYLAIRQLISRKTPPEAAFCFNDVVALGVMLGLQSMDLQPGRDFSVVGFDDIPESRLWRPSLSTVSVPPDVVGRRAVELLLSAIQGPPSPERSVLIPPKLVIRDSCGMLQLGTGKKTR